MTFVLVISVKNASGDAECCHALKYPELRICLNDTLQHNVENEGNKTQILVIYN